MNILIVGVGGQGTLLSSKILGNYAALQGLDCKLNEVHGMSQRGGNVVTHVRLGKKVFSPIIPLGDADLILSFEALETYRAINYLKKDGIVLSNTQMISPMPVIMGKAQYPNAIHDIQKMGYKTYFVDALSKAIEAGSEKATNVVMIGMLTKLLNLDKEKMVEALKECVKPQFIDLNIKALEIGYNEI